MRRALGNSWGVAGTLDGFAHLAAAQDRPERALRLAGAAAALLEAIGAAPQLLPQQGLERRLAPARLALGEAAAAARFAEGRGLSLDRAVAEALAADGPPDSPPPAAGGAAAPAGSGAPGAGRFGLTPRERDVAALVARGLTNRQIAEALVISERTAMKHVEHILDKLGFRSRVQVAGWAVERGLLPPDGRRGPPADPPA